MDLFDGRQISKEPLASRMRPQSLDEYIGQEHIVGKGRLLRRAIAADQLSSVIFYGPPGTGKTTLARVIAAHTKSAFTTLNAVLTGVQHIREAIAEADRQYRLYNRRTILFVDEVHRWNKSQQDALLPWVENGTVILVGATTENPFFEVNKALVSRSRVFQLRSLTEADLMRAAERALSDRERGYGRYRILFEAGALEHLVQTANGDARSLLNALELAVETSGDHWPLAEGEEIRISREAAEESIQQKVVLYDRDGDYHYDIISAFIKSLRGRDPDAALYWLARMVAAGEDPHFIFRRMLISACEDTGLADPQAICIVEACARAFDRVGMPEGRYHLAHAALYLATAPKSNSSMAFFDALAAVQKADAEVPNHLKDASRDSEGFGHGEGYMYPHAYRDHWVAQQYLPSSLMGRVFYTPGSQGYERSIRDEVLSHRELQIASMLESETRGLAGSADPRGIEGSAGELLSFSPKSDQREGGLMHAEKEWRRRLDSNRAALLMKIRSRVMELADLRRHSRVLVWPADDGLLIWEAVRCVPEGLAAGICRLEKSRQVLEQYAATLESLDRPLLTASVQGLDQALAASADLSAQPFDRLIGRNCIQSEADIRSLGAALTALDGRGSLAPGWICVIAQRIPASAQRISALIRSQKVGDDQGTQALLAEAEAAENAFFSDSSHPLFSWDAQRLIALLSEAGLAVSYREEETEEERRIDREQAERWFDAERSPYGRALAQALGREGSDRIKKLLYETAVDRLLIWRSRVIFCKIQAFKEAL